jgi:nitrite reductase/ring-hydroxylating ferredoxin subunit
MPRPDGLVSAVILGVLILGLVRRRRRREPLVHVGSPAFRPAGAGLEFAVVERDGARWTREDVLVVRRTTDGSTFAICNACPHFGYPLHEGEIEKLPNSLLGAPVVSCPAHAYLFDMKRGTCVTNGGCAPAAVYAARVVGAELYLSEMPVEDGAEVGEHVLDRAQANALQLQMVDLALRNKYGDES